MGDGMTDQERDTISNVLGAVSGAIGIWPQKHPAAGMVMGIQEQSDQTYERLKSAQGALLKMLLKEPTP